jgi:steroid delta-isomerase-like uncharacterized protein
MLLCLALLIAGCATTQTDIEQWIKGEEEAWSSQDIEGILSFYTDDCIYEDLAGPTICRGKEEIRTYAMNVFAAFPDVKIETKSFFVSGNHMCIEAVISGTYLGNIPGSPPANGKSFSVRCAHICELHGGKATRVTDYYDMASVMRQLDLLPSPPEP